MRNTCFRDTNIRLDAMVCLAALPMLKVMPRCTEDLGLNLTTSKK
jgi:hypothetical protein